MALYNSGSGQDLIADVNLNYGLVTYWKFDEASWSGTPDEVFDSSSPAVDRLIIPAGHNFNDELLDLRYSDDASVWVRPDYYEADLWFQIGTGLIMKKFTAVAHRYWQFFFSLQVVNPQMAELFLTQGYTWERNPNLPTGRFDDEFNVQNEVTAGGQDRFLVHGDAKRVREYTVRKIEAKQKVHILALNDLWAGSKPFWLADHNNQWIYGKLTRPIRIIEDLEDAYFTFTFDFKEVLP